MTSGRWMMVVAGALALGVAGACTKGDAKTGAGTDTSARTADSSRTAAGSPAPGAGASATGGAAASATPAPLPGVSVTTGVYTAAQAARGHEVYATSCAQCHTMSQHSGTAFATAWNNRRLFDLYEIVHNTMPLDNPGGLSDQEYIDVVAYLLELNGVPAGTSALQADPSALKGLRIDVKGSAGP